MTIDDKIGDEKLKCNIKREAAKLSALYSGKIDKHEYLAGKEILHSDQSRIIEQANFTYSPLGKAFGKQTTTIKDQGRKQIDTITNQNERLAALTNKDDDKDNYNEIFEELGKIWWDKRINQWINRNGLTYHFKGNTARKRFDDFSNGKELFKKTKSSEMKIEEAKKLENAECV